MTPKLRLRESNRRQPAALAGFFLLQTMATVFFVGDAISEMILEPDTTHSITEAMVALALFLGMVFGGMALRRTLELMRAQKAALVVASGALIDMIRAQFSHWGLTTAEADVAFLALKGLDVAELAELRGSAQGTIRAQLTKVYAKAGVSNRAQFAALFVEDLLGAGEPQAKADLVAAP